ncbi:MAG: transcription termination factor NusA [Candidatus Desulfofervidaceae bacterium]|nr:transcription termination factor NusA [Candidatus Desulfofervidaceae bacterium]
MTTQLKRIIDQVSKDRGFDRNFLIRTIEEAIRSAARKKYGQQADVDVAYNEETGEVEVYLFKTVVEDLSNPVTEITLSEAQKLDSEVELGDSIGVKLDTSEFGRIAAQAAKQVILQRMKEAEREVIYEEFKDRKGEVVNGIVQRLDKEGVIVNLGKTESLLPWDEIIPNKDNFKRGDRLRAYILDVKKESRGPQIILTRTHPAFLVALFTLEVPEIAEGVVKIINAAREPGNRAKIAVTSQNTDVDPVGACVGIRGVRVQNVVRELKGEKIDIVPWDPDPAKFVCNALAPAKVLRVVLDKDEQSMEIVVPDDQLSLAIGKQGQNVRLASKLTGWRLDVRSKTRYEEMQRLRYETLLKVEGMTEEMADMLSQNGIGSAEELAQATVDELEEIGLNEKQAQALIAAAQRFMSLPKDTGEVETGGETTVEG